MIMFRKQHQIFDQINAARMSIKAFFQKHYKNLIDPKLLNCSVYLKYIILALRISVRTFRRNIAILWKIVFPQPQSCMSWIINFESVVITTANSMQTSAQAKQQSQHTFLENPTVKPLRHAPHSWWILNSTELIQKSHPQSNPTPHSQRDASQHYLINLAKLLSNILNMAK